MRLYGIKMHNFMRFGESDNCIVFDVDKESKEKINKKELSMDQIYQEISEGPLDYVEKVKNKDDNIMKGIIGIAGKVNGSFDASNGSGKSTIFEAISYLMYDKIVRQTANNDKKGSAGASIMTKLSGKYPTGMTESYVEGYFEEDGRLYRLKRGRSLKSNHKSNSAVFEFDNIMGDEVDKLSGHKKCDTKKSVEEVIVEDYDIFVNTVMFGQNDAGKFLTGTDKIKKDMIIELLKLEHIVHGCVDVIRSKKKIENDKLNDFQSRAKSLQDLVIKTYKNLENSDLEEDEEYSEDLIDRFSSLVELSLEEIEEKKALIIKTLTTIQENIKRLEDSDIIKRITALVDDGKRLVAEKKVKEEKKEKDLSDWKKLVEDSSTRKRKIIETLVNDEKTAKSVLEKITNCQKVVDEFDEASNKEEMEKCQKAKGLKEQYGTNAKSIEEKRNSTIKNLSDFNAILTLKKVELNKLLKQTSEGEKASEFVCDECKSIVTKAHILKRLAELKAVIAKNEEGKATVVALLDKVHEAKSSIDQRLKKISEYEVLYEKLVAKKATFDASCQSLEDLKVQSKDFVGRIEETTEESSKLDEKIKEYEEKCVVIEKNFVSETEELVKEIGKKRSEVLELKQGAEAIKIDIAARRKEESVTKDAIGVLDREIGVLKEKRDQVIDLGKQISDEDKGIVIAKKQLQRYLILEKAFGLEGIQTRIVARYLPLLNLHIKKYLDILSNGKLSVDFFVNSKSKVDMEIIGGLADTYVMLSGGEKMIIRLAVDIGLSLLSFSRTEKIPDMICLDEIFGPLDKDHTKSVFLMLDELKDRFNRVFLISHKSEIQTLVENNIIVEKASGNRGLSKIVGICDISV